jgi:hypothetical protein
MLKLLKKSRMASRAFSTSAKDPYDNIPQGIWDLTERKIYKVPNHPIKILIDRVTGFFEQGKISDIQIPGEKFKVF